MGNEVKMAFDCYMHIYGSLMGNEVQMAFDCYMHIYGFLMGNEVKNYVDGGFLIGIGLFI
jgi:hypothetical protein